MSTPNALPVVAYRFKDNRGHGKFEYEYYEPDDYLTAYKDNCLEIDQLCKVSDALAAIAATSAAPHPPGSADNDYLRGRYAQHPMPTLGVTFAQPPSAAMQPLADEVHSCSFFCNLPNCIKTQRDLLRDQITKDVK